MRPKLSPEPEPQGPPPTGPRTCRRRPMTAGVNPWMLNLAPAFVGTHQDLLGGYEAGSLLIADSERVADCRPSLIAPIRAWWLTSVTWSQVRPEFPFCALKPERRHRPVLVICEPGEH